MKIQKGLSTGAIMWMLAVFFTLTGCHQAATPSGVQSDTKVFEAASPEVKGQWDKINAAVVTNDYSTAIISGRKLLQNDTLTPEQRGAINDTITVVNTKLTAAVEKGDADAMKAAQEVRAHWRD